MYKKRKHNSVVGERNSPGVVDQRTLSSSVSTQHVVPVVVYQPGGGSPGTWRRPAHRSTGLGQGSGGCLLFDVTHGLVEKVNFMTDFFALSMIEK